MNAVRPAARQTSRWRKPRALAVGLAALATTAVALPIASASADPLTGVDLSTYARTARLDLPTPATDTPPAGSLLAQEASSVAYDPQTPNSLYVVGDGGTSVVQVDKTTGALIDSMTLAPGGSAQGTEFYDTEGITYAGNGKFVMTEERDRRLVEFTYAAGTTLQRSDTQSVKLGSTIGNIGLEGVTWDPANSRFIVVKETQPSEVFETGVDFTPPGSATNPSDPSSEPANLFDPSLLHLGDFSDVFALSNVPALSSTADASHLLVISQQSGKIVNTDRSGNVESSLTIRRDAGNDLSVPDQTDEGVTMDDDGTLYVVNEQGGGSNVPQLWVYRPSSATDQGPTAVTLSNAQTSIPDTSSTAARLKLADVAVTDADDFGQNDLSVSGADASDFEVDETGLYLKAGTTLDAATKSSYSVNVNVDDPSTSASPDASTAFTVNVTAGASGGSATLAVTEVAPWGSGDAPYAADWFELTNTGDTAVDLTGYRMDDDSHSGPDGATLEGVGSLAPGKSAIFLESPTATQAAADTIIDGFKSAWFGNDAPAGLQIGWYSHSSVGLSKDEDEVNVYDDLGAKVTGVAFGVSNSGQTFDNAAGLGSTTLPDPLITALSNSGVHGAFTSGGETGSPGTTNFPLAITEVSPTGSGNTTYAADWFELTNDGSSTVNLAAWRIDDSHNDVTAGGTLTGVSTLAPGESAVFVEGTSATVAAFESAWFGSDVPAGLQVGFYAAGSVGFSNNGDEVNLFDASGSPVTGVAFGTAPSGGASFDNAAGVGSATHPLPTISDASVVGTNGAFSSTSGGEIGSPGTIGTAATPPAPTDVAVTEAAPWGSDSAYGGDWFELTNFGSSAVDLSGWRMDDGSNAASSGAVLNGVGSLAPGESAVFIEGTVATATAFENAWFPIAPPLGLQVGYYAGGSLSLSGGGDQVNVFDGGGDHMAGIAFGADRVGVSFDNSAGLGSGAGAPPTITTFSAPGVNGAFIAGGETGSPGTTTQGPAAAVTFDVPAFANQAQGTIGATKSITVTNSGTDVLRVSRVRIADADGSSSGDFLIADENCTDGTIPANGTCTVLVRFAPSRANAISNESLVVTSNTPAGNDSADLTANSTDLPAGPKGDAGAQGDKGDTGSKGDTGAQGSQGATGPQGDTGAAGASGAKGDTGAAGAQGAKGDRGSAGRDAKVSCKVTTAKGHQKVTCKLTLVRASGRAAKRARATTRAHLTRNGRTVATGHISGLRATRHVTRGTRYVLRVAGLSIPVRIG
ncbi:MAG TPA: lamin tail domain-containing protein [Conexibacter sp.]